MERKRDSIPKRNKMIIKFYCDNGHWFTKTDAELREEKQSQRFCNLCGKKLHIEQQSLENVITFDLEEQIKNNIDSSVAKIGWDNTLDIIQRNKNQACYRLYKIELEKRGFKINE